MSIDTARAKALIQQLDLLIERYGRTDPDLHSGLQAHRCALQDALTRRSTIEYAELALQVVAWVKFIFDHLS